MEMPSASICRNGGARRPEVRVQRPSQLPVVEHGRDRLAGMVSTVPGPMSASTYFTSR